MPVGAGLLFTLFAPEWKSARKERPRAAVLLSSLANFEDVKARSERRELPEILDARET